MKTINITTKQIIRSLFLVLVVVFTFQSCEQDLELQPEDARLVGDAAFEDASSYKAFLGKLYGGFSLSGQIGPAGLPDLAGLDEGFSNYLRLYWKMQELTTDEAVVGWNDGTIKDLHGQVWTSGNEFIKSQLDELKHKSPTSLKISLRQIRSASKMSLKDELIMEYRMVQKCVEIGDFFEGVRAMLVEKDRKPAWNPSNIKEIDDDKVNKFFESLGDQDLILTK